MQIFLISTQTFIAPTIMVAGKKLKKVSIYSPLISLNKKLLSTAKAIIKPLTLVILVLCHRKFYCGINKIWRVKWRLKISLPPRKNMSQKWKPKGPISLSPFHTLALVRQKILAILWLKTPPTLWLMLTVSMRFYSATATLSSQMLSMLTCLIPMSLKAYWTASPQWCQVVGAIT